MDPEYLLFAHKKCQLLQLASCINIEIKKAAQDNGITASQALDSTFVNNIIGKDNAFRFMSSLTNSPAYWEQQKKNVMAMVRQHGIFTLFITLSAAETHWIALLKILKKTVDNEDDADVSDLNFEEKARLIRLDPVTCALYFNHKFREIKKTWTNTNDGPFGNYKLKLSYHRIEFQHRGSPHVHMLVWLENAPIYNPNDASSCIPVTEFIDSIITTNSNDADVKDLIKYQTHKCTNTCRKQSRGQKACRFGAPFPPMDQTRILSPLPDEYEMSAEESKKIREFIKKMNNLLEEGQIESFDEFLLSMECSIEEFIHIIRSQLKCCKIFVKRTPKDCRVNTYNKKILLLMQSNMDIQFVLDPYACIGYIVDYINKASRGVSSLMRSCVEHLKLGDYSIRQKLKAVANTFYNGAEISTQEAAWCRLRLPMSSSSVGVIFINTGPSKVIA